jgi:hypothetical protein
MSGNTETDSANGAESGNNGSNNGRQSNDGRASGSGQSGRGRRRDNRPRQQQPRFEGREPTLKGHVYDFTGKQMPDQYIKTTKEIKNFVGRTYTKFTGDLVQAVEDLSLDNPQAPTDPDPTNPLAVEIWKMELKEHREKVQHYKNF